jgi:hypothetical protein
MIRIEAGERQYELVNDWGTLPEGWTWGQVAGVACDSQDRVHVYTRTNHPYMIFDRSGTLVHHGGEDDFDMAHSLYIDAADSVFVLSHRGHFIMKFDRDGELMLTLGERGKASDSGYTKEGRVPASPWASGGGLPTVNGVGHGAPPFNQPTDVAVAANGDIFVSDGYRNSRVHKFAPDGRLLKSWGEPGRGSSTRHTASGWTVIGSTCSTVRTTAFRFSPPRASSSACGSTWSGQRTCTSTARASCTSQSSKTTSASWISTGT